MSSTKEQKSMQELWQNAYLYGGNAAYLETLYDKYLDDPNSVPREWRDTFQTMCVGASNEVNHSRIREHFKCLAQTVKGGMVADADGLQQAQRQAQVQRLIAGYRNDGHLHARLDPLKLKQRKCMHTLDLAYYGLDKFTQQVFHAGDFKGLKGNFKLQKIVDALEKTYCGSIGCEFSHIANTSSHEWLCRHIESHLGQPKLSVVEKKRALEKLVAANGLEKYLGRKYVGQKRFSLEGGDSLIPLLDTVISTSSCYSMRECVIGMAHRGRLNVLINILGKSPQDLFDEFEGKSKHYKPDYANDVKYHMGFSSNIMLNDKNIHLALAFNPSHLEIVGPVVEGSTRARQRRRKDKLRKEVLPLIIHGDAAFAGQGVVMETFAMSQARGFRTGGTIHVVINNQIGFTTAHPLDSRTGLYCTDIAKMVQAPIIHVNGDDVETVVMVAKLAAEYRETFHQDIVIDLVCYRRHGHNESDEPAATQPLMYQAIKKHPVAEEIYYQQLLNEKIIDQAGYAQLDKDYKAALDKGAPVAGTSEHSEHYEYAVNWAPYLQSSPAKDIKTAISLNAIKQYSKAMLSLPEGFTLQAQVQKIMLNRAKMTAGELPIDWGYAENMAYASLLDQGFPLRLCGQDSGRGTFAHRHAMLHGQTDGKIYTPLQHISDKQASCIVIDSILSEEAVLAFEYGFSTAEPDNLVIWEAQFGDFANGAQVVIDQFIASGEQKWSRLCGLVMLLPHGYEGMGAEHSSARLERYLQLCAQDNMQICVPSNAAQIFHLLRRQMLRPLRKPLIVMSPKSLLRNKLASVSLKDLTEGCFQEVVPEVDKQELESVSRVILCSGKVYYDLLQKRRENKLSSAAIIRLEQLYPFPQQALTLLLKHYKHVDDIVWCQEEPKNQGAWYAIRHFLEECLQENQKISYVGRASSAAPAVGVPSIHKQEQATLVAEALKLD
jgi:2-oxoglutarate dehydrogenase E1 component